MADLQVADSEIQDISKLYGKIGNLLDRQFSGYLKSMDSICNNAIKSGRIYENLVKFKEEAKKSDGEFLEIMKDLESNLDKYLKEIDKKDDYLY